VEETTERRPAWKLTAVATPHELERLVAFDPLDRLTLNACGKLVDGLVEWLAPQIGARPAFLLNSNLFNLLVEVGSVGVDVGIAVERTRSLAENDPHSKPGAEVDCERWVALALVESELKPSQAESLIPKTEQHAEK